MQLIISRLLASFLAVLTVAASAPVLAAYVFQSIDYPNPETATTQTFPMNSAGQIVGTAYRFDGSFITSFSYDFWSKGFTSISTSPLQGGQLIGVNDAGTMVGNTGDGCIAPETPFIRSSGKKPTYAQFSIPGYANAEARAIGNNGLVSGFAYNIDNLATCIADGFADIVDTIGFIYDPVSHALTTFLASPLTIAQGINIHGQVVGSVALDDGVACPTCAAGRYGFSRAAGGAITYFRVNGVGTTARGINDSGLITGYIPPGLGFVVTLAGSPSYQAITVPAAQLFSVPGAVGGTFPESITNGGEIVGDWMDAAMDGHGFTATPPTIATSKDACKGGGWQSLTRLDGSTFKNQGDCVSYTNNGK